MAVAGRSAAKGRQVRLAFLPPLGSNPDRIFCMQTKQVFSPSRIFLHPFKQRLLEKVMHREYRGDHKK